MEVRNIVVDDYFKVMAVLDEWWGGRSMTHLLPRLFFEHFQQTSFVIEKDGEVVAFLVGFVSQTDESKAYIHFVGVNPDFRKQGLANDLYRVFSKRVKEQGCCEVQCITTPINTGSIAFHEAIGFTANLVKSYAGEGQDRVVFWKRV